jgi:hypothetical protein
MRLLFGIAAVCLGLWAAPVHAATVYGWLECVAQNSWVPLFATKTIFVTTRIIPVESDVMTMARAGRLDEANPEGDGQFLGEAITGGIKFREKLGDDFGKAFRDRLKNEGPWFCNGWVFPQGPYDTVEQAGYWRDVMAFPKREIHKLEILEFPYP